MEFYFAPMEGVSGYVYRKAHHEFFPHMDKYFIPFFVPKENSRFSQKEKAELSRENNADTCTVPQLLANKAQPFIRMARELQEMGYEEINLNLGCPSGTVVSKKKGAGFLGETDELDAFLDCIFRELDMKISIKTRVGMNSPQEFARLLEIYNQYPVSELIIHPRVREDYYKKPLHMECFALALKESKIPVCYNGDLFTEADYHAFAEKFPRAGRVMLGRGMITNPALAEAIKLGKRIDRDTFRRFHDRLYEDHRRVLYGEKNVLFHMKELWFYMACMFSDYPKYLKKICKAQSLAKYEDAVNVLFYEQEFLPTVGYCPPEKRG
ncbi:MAG: tRNA-dihydrouridine synthase family protein [Eubacteriales bacterium]|nr:tRNA-dihydrouridine synthase family protein [Eubacteriales bacterium]MDO5540332.1 tRNA-dihydrouridine synthase family protein [Eubacteriales bacterium]